MATMTNDRGGRILRDLVSAARALTANQVGFPVACYRISNLLWQAKSFGVTRYDVFSQFKNETRHLPIGSERLTWEENALLERDEVLAAICSRYRNTILLACFDIIESFNDAKEQFGPILVGETVPDRSSKRFVLEPGSDRK